MCCIVGPEENCITPRPARRSNRTIHTHTKTQPCFLLGEGLGAALAYRVYQMQGGRFWDGSVFLSPMLAFPRRLRPPPFLLTLARRLNPARWGAVPIVPYSRLYLDMLTDPVRRQEVSRKGRERGWVWPPCGVCMSRVADHLNNPIYC